MFSDPGWPQYWKLVMLFVHILILNNNTSVYPQFGKFISHLVLDVRSDLKVSSTTTVLSDHSSTDSLRTCMNVLPLFINHNLSCFFFMVFVLFTHLSIPLVTVQHVYEALLPCLRDFIDWFSVHQWHRFKFWQHTNSLLILDNLRLYAQ